MRDDDTDRADETTVRIDSQPDRPVLRPAGRYPCDWCGEPDRWPDQCTETPGTPQDPNAERCTSMIEHHCGLGDHRRCVADACAIAARWHDPVRRSGTVTARITGVAWVVVSTIDNNTDVAVVGIADDLHRAETTLRAPALRRGGIPTHGPRGKGLVYIVRGSDGALF